MIFRLLKNDLLHGKLSNLIMVLFIAISTMLSCTSINAIYSSINQISYFMEDMGNVADLNYSMMNVTPEDKEKMLAFLQENNVTEYQLEEDVSLPLPDMKFEGHKDSEGGGNYLTTLPEKYNFIFDENNKIPNIKEGYVGVPLSMKKAMDLKVGENLIITRDKKKFTYEIQCFIRDSLYGSEMVGQKRFILHENDYQTQYNATQNKEHSVVLSIKSKKDHPNFEKKMLEANLPENILVSKDTAYLSFLGISIGSNAILMISGLILLCMSFLIIRFTILFQIENNYSEIGIMKAIGLSHSQIKPLYMAKYIGIALFGGTIGFISSIFVTQMFKEMQSGVVPILNDSIGIWLSVLMVIIILMMVYSVTALILRRLKKQSVMDAIRKGNEGETYQEVSRLQLKKCKKLPISIFLACNEFIAHMKNTVMMIFIYGFCVLLMLMPLTLKDSFQGDAFIQILKMSSANLYTQQVSTTMDLLDQQRKQVEKDLKEYDKDVSVKMETMTSASISMDGNNVPVYMMKRADENITYDVGGKPVLKNEIAISSTLAKQFDKTVGDALSVSFEKTSDTYMITGVYTSMMNLGNSLIAGKDLNYEYAYNGYLVINFSGDATKQKESIDIVMKNYKEHKLITSQEIVKNLSGDMGSQIGYLSDMMSVILLFIVFALTILFSKMQLIRSKKAIILLQNIGYHRQYIRRWQLMRCFILCVVATGLGMLAHTLLTSRLLELFFKAMGMGTINVSFNAFNAYILYPVTFITVIMVAQLIVNLTIKYQNIKDLSEE
ncbi:MAG: ABC transporter permease [Coprobacillus sp.]